jgi:PAS domain S-box-containing protein
MQRLLALIYIDVPVLRPGTVGAYFLAFVSVAVATALRLAVDPFVAGVQFITFYPAVIITTLIGGLGAGLFCVVLGVAAAVFFVLPPQWSFYIEDLRNLLLVMLFMLIALSNVIFIAGMRYGIERRRDEQALQAGKDRLQFALDAAQLGSWQYDPRRGLASWDKRGQQITDMPQDEVVIEEFFELVHPDDRERFWTVRNAALDPADPKPYVNEYRIVRRDGEVRWVESRGLSYFEGVGTERRLVNFVGTIQDITERKEREEKEHLLMREVNHRAKNMLSVVDSIAHQTATRNPEDFIERFSERIQALSANQDLLIRNEWNGVEVKDLVCAQLAHFADLIGPRITLDGPKLRLNPVSAQAIGLAIHELATNAGKYGALSTGKGRVNIGWRIDSDTLTMNWTEREGPPVSGPQRRGFGTIVMETMAERSMDGKVHLDYARSGLTWRLACPAASVVESGASVSHASSTR